MSAPEKASSASLLYVLSGAALFGLIMLVVKGLKSTPMRCSRLHAKYQRALQERKKEEADVQRFFGARENCPWAVEAERTKEVEHEFSPVASLGMAETTKPALGDKTCGCKIIKAKSKGGTTRFAAKCAGSKMTRYVDKDFAKSHKGKTFCVKTLRPFNTLMGRAMAHRKWAKEHARGCR